MTKTGYLCACAISALAIASASPAMAQTAPDTSTDAIDSSRDIVITGSIIRGTPEDAALPVNVIGSADLEKQGSPSAVELLKALPTSSAVLGDANQFDSRSQGAEGIATANLRGLSPQRTLVLLNNRRLATAGNGVPSVDINLIPAAAIGRIEVLKDGGATTYGSDAIAGVVNFITRTDQEGFRVAGAYRFVQNTDGDIDASVSYGHVGDGFRFLVAASFNKRGELLARDRDFAINSYLTNPQGGWTGGGNPANFLLVGPSATPGVVTPYTGVVADSSCAALGGFVGVGNGRCFTQYTGFDTLIDLEKRFVGWADVEVDLGSRTKLEVTALLGRTTIPHYLTSPSYLLTQLPSVASMGGSSFNSGLGVGFYVPAANPGFAAYKAANPTLFTGIAAGATGAIFPLLLFRPYMAGGNPSTLADPDETGSARGMRKSESMRFTAELKGDVGKLNWSVSATYHDYYRYIDGYDSFGDRVQLALRGLGGPNCTGTTPGANGCLWLNPFGNAVTAGAVNGTTNPQGNAALANNQTLTDWFFVKSFSTVDSQLFVLDANLSGSTGIKLPGGDVQFGIGAQYRYSWFETKYGNNNNLVSEPCRDTPITGNTNPATCSPTTTGGAPSPATGALAFLGTNANSFLKGGVKAVFGEVQLPIFDTFNVQGALRYEDYGGQVGSTVNPQVRARWQVTDWLAVRGGYGTTFRGPTLANITPGFVTSLQLIGSAFKPVDVYGNAGLTPEKSENWSGGLLLKVGGFNASVDYFRYNLKNVIVTDPLSAMVATLFPTGAANTCAANAALAARFTFTTAGCTAATTVASIARVKTVLQNGATLKNEGIDVSVNYRATQFLGSGLRFGIGADVTRVLHNRISDIFVEGTKVQAAYDGVGLLNYQSTLYPVPKWKGQAYVDLGGGPVDARVTVNYTDGLHDQRYDTRSGPFAPNCALGLAAGVAAGTACVDTGLTPNAASVLTGADLKEFVSVDFNIQIKLPWNVTLTGTVFNIFDKDPPFAREDYNYEPFVGNPYGRMIKLGLSTKF